MSNLKKVLALVLVLALSLTMFAGAIETVLPYDDVDELTAEQLDSLKLLYALGVIKGDDENSVNPTDTLTRGELCAILYRLYTGDAEEKYVSTYSTDCPYFDDVEDGKWYVPYVNWAYIKGVVAGYGNGNFGPMDNVDGVQAATMLARLVGYEIGSENWELVARKHAIELGLDDGVSSKDLFGTDLSRGDMIVMVANVLDCYEVGTKVTLAEKIFDLEIIRGAILLGADKLGSTDYSVFAFKDEISGNVKYFITDLLSIEEKPTVDEIGQKYTLYVAKTTEVNGYKVLYAAYEEAEGAYYKTVTGTVDDGKLNVEKADKDDYLLKLLDKRVIAYINGEVVANNAADAFAAFKASYGLKNSAAYKLIDNDGDGLYEYIFVERLTLANMNTTEIVANVVAYNNITGAYTLSDGKEYVPGQYWGVDKDDKITNSVVNAEDAIFAAIGKDGFTASSVQYKFTIENGKYLMKAEICDETYFAGNYVLSMGTVGTSTYKGMTYVQFLTEDNTALYAYVNKINHMDVRRFYGILDYAPSDDLFKALYAQLFYVNAYGDDTVELFTPEYINSNYVNDVQDPESVTLTDALSELVLPAVGNVYTNIGLKLGEKGGIIPAEPFNANRAYFIKIGETYQPTVFSSSTYSGYFATLATDANAKLAATEKKLEDARQALANANVSLNKLNAELVDLQKTLADKETALNTEWTNLDAKAKIDIGEEGCIWDTTLGVIERNPDTGVVSITSGTLVGVTEEDLFKAYNDALKEKNDAAKAVDDKQGEITDLGIDTLTAAVTTAEDELAELKTSLVLASDIYYLSAKGQGAVNMSIDLKVTYDSDEYQLFKAYGTWYVQSYAEETNDKTFEVYFTVDGKTTGVKYDENLDRFCVYDYAADDFVKDPNTKQNMIFNIGSANEADLHKKIGDAIDGVFEKYDADNNHAGTNPGDYIWNTAKAVNTSKGVVFAYGQYPVDGVYRWRAYNFDEFNVNFFGQGGTGDDNTKLGLDDQMIYTVSNGNVYAKAMKVTVDETPDAKDKKWDALPMGWMIKNSMVFVYGMQRGTITAEGETVQAVLPNGATKDVFVPYGMLITGIGNEARYGNVYYAVLSDKGDVVSLEYICNIFDVLNTGANDLPLLTNDSFKDYAADGTVTLQGKLGLTYTAKIDVDKTFFTVKDTAGTDRFVSSADFAKYLDEHAGATFEIYVDAYGYNYAKIK